MPVNKQAGELAMLKTLLLTEYEWVWEAPPNSADRKFVGSKEVALFKFACGQPARILNIGLCDVNSV